MQRRTCQQDSFCILLDHRRSDQVGRLNRRVSSWDKYHRSPFDTATVELRW